MDELLKLEIDNICENMWLGLSWPQRLTHTETVPLMGWGGHRRPFGATVISSCLRVSKFSLVSSDFCEAGWTLLFNIQLQSSLGLEAQIYNPSYSGARARGTQSWGLPALYATEWLQGQAGQLSEIMPQNKKQRKKWGDSVRAPACHLRS